MIISNFKSIHKAYVQSVMDVTWPEAVEIFMYHREHNRKEDVQLFNLGQFKTLDDSTVEWARKSVWKNGQPTDEYRLIPNTVRRCKANLLRIFGIVLDFDSDVSIMDAEEKYKDFEYVVYTTFRNLTETNEKGELIHKFRMVIPFSQPVEYKDIEKYQDDIKTIFPDVDSASFSMSQAFYYHSGIYHYANYNKGVMIDPYKDLKEKVILPPTPKAFYQTEFTDDQNKQYKEMVFQSLQSCRDVHYRSVVTLVTICKSIELTFTDFDHLLNTIAAPGSALHRPDVRRQVWNSVDADKCRKETRDNFIQKHGGIPVIEQPRGILTQEQAIKSLKRRNKWI